MYKKKPVVTRTGRYLAGAHPHKGAPRQSEMSVNTPCSAARGNSVKPNIILSPTLGCAILSTEIVPSDFTCSVSSLGQYSLHYPPADTSLRRLQLAGSNAHSWIERIHSCFAFHIRLREGIRSHLCTSLRNAKIPRQVSLAVSSHLGYKASRQASAGISSSSRARTRHQYVNYITSRTYTAQGTPEKSITIRGDR